MGKALSKRSVDITTEVKNDDLVEEGAGKMEKIEDVDQLKPQLNGDTNTNDIETPIKEKIVEVENTEEKDLSTEKEQTPVIGDSIENTEKVNDNNETTINENKEANESNTTEKKDVNESNITENNDSSKKKKKDKARKWSLRNLSFGKKDKQKPNKKDDGTVSGDCDKVPEEANENSPVEDKSEEAKPEENGVKTPEINTISENGNNINENIEENKVPITNGEVTEITNNDVSSDKVISSTTTEEIKSNEVILNNHTTEETQKIELAVEATTKDTSIQKMDQSADVKIEVKAENLTDENNVKPTFDDNIQIKQNLDIESVKISDDAIIENIQNLTPPPLPINPPPSQLMVSALNDAKTNEQDPINIIQESQIIQNDNDVPSEVKNLTAGIELSSIPEKIVNIIEGTPISVNNNENLSNDNQTAIQDKDEIINELLIENKTTEIKNLIENNEEPIILQTSEININELKVDVKEDVKVDEDLKTNLTNEVEQILHEAEAEVINERISQTIALIDEVTQEAITKSNEKLQDLNHSTSVLDVLNTDDQETVIKNVDSSTKISQNINIPTEIEISDSTTNITVEAGTQLNEPNILNNTLLNNLNGSTTIDVTENEPITNLGDKIMLMKIDNNIDDKIDDIAAITSVTTNLKENGISEEHKTNETTNSEILNGIKEILIDPPCKLIEELSTEKETTAVSVAQ